MDLEKIKELMAAMEKRSMSRLALKDKNGFELELERKSSVVMEPSVVSMPQAAPPQAPQKHVVQEETPAPSVEKKGEYITSPMVGTFYAKASPEADLYVKVGDTVKPDTVVCIIEAMKVMNEVKAGISGKVVESLLKDGAPVEFGTKLFRVE